MRILYVEDNPGDAKLLQYEFAESAPDIEIEWSPNCIEAMEKISRSTSEAPAYDVILTDMQLPDGKGTSLLPFLKECGLQIPVIIITGLQDRASAVSALKAGVSDYVVKDEGYLSTLPGILKSAVDRHHTGKTRQATAIHVLYGAGNFQDSDSTRKHFIQYAPFIHLDIVSSGQAVLDVLSHHMQNSIGYPCDVVLLGDQLPDVMLPALIREIFIVRKLDIPIVLISSGESHELAVQAFQTGVDDYVIKSPGYLNYLPHVLENVFHRMQVEREKEALKKSEEYYRMLTENSSDTISVSDIHGTIKYISPSIERSLGHRPSDIVGKDLFYKIHPDDALRAREMIDAIIRHPGVSYGPVENRYLDAGGAWRWLEAFGRLVRDPAGEWVIIMNARDSNQRKTTEEALRTSQMRLAEAMELANMVYWEIDPQTDRFMLNDPFYAMLKTTADAEGGYTMAVKDYAERFIHPDDRQLFWASREEWWKREQDLRQLEARIVRRDGEVRFLITRVHNIRDASGQITRMLGTNQDISERKKMEMAIQQSESLYRSLVENPLVGISIDQGRRVRFANRRFCEIIGYRLDEIVDKLDTMNLVHPDDREKAKENIRSFVRDQVPIQEDLHIQNKNGKTLMVKGFWSPITYRGSLAVACLMIDTTLEKTLENQLRQSQKMEAIGALAGGIAHDFNNILTALTGYGSLLKMEMESGKPARMSYVESILSASLKASNLTQGLLAFARQQLITLKRVNINDIVTGMKKMLMRLLTEDIVLKTNLCPENPVIMADVGQIDQILINLAVNARDAMPAGGVITLETKTVFMDTALAELHGLGGPGAYVVLSVSDTGTGMDEITREHIFEPFFTTKEPGKGTGMGLATVYGIVKKHQGDISVYSEKGIGTIFRVYLPAIDEASEEAQQKTAPVGGTETILLAEDDSSVRDSIASLLSRFGYTVIQAVDGQDAIDRFNAHSGRVDILLFDSVMPKKNGRQAYDVIAAAHPAVKVIFMSGYTRDVVLDKGIEEQRFDFLSKPAPHDILLAKIREVLDRC